MKNIEIKLVQDETSKISTVKKLNEKIAELLQDPMNYRTIKINFSEDQLKIAKDAISEKYDCTVRDSVTDGCYGARTGKSSEGLTIWMHPKELVERYVQTSDDGTEKTEFVNPYYLFEEHGTLVESLDGEQFEEWAEALGKEYKAENTYNYSTDFGSLKSETAAFMFDFQFSWIETEKSCLVSVMFHCGGDPRGNYTSKVVYKFNSMDDFYSIIYPSLHLLSEEES